MMINKELICIDNDTHNWREAGNIVGNLLLKNQYVTETYLKKIIDYVEEFGPYIVFAPGIALFHARPEDGVLKQGVALTVFKEGINFCAGVNDPVYLVFALAPESNNSHIELLKDLSILLSDSSIKEQILHSTDADNIANIINSFDYKDWVMPYFTNVIIYS